MIYLKSFDLASRSSEEGFFFSFNRRTCFDSGYPFGVFSAEKDLERIEFDDITIFSGDNGSGKSTLLNIISEKLGLGRRADFNKTYFFDPYCQLCDYESVEMKGEKKTDWLEKSRIITSDDVFEHILSVRNANDGIFRRRAAAFDEKSHINARGGNYKGDRPRNIHIEDVDSVRKFAEYSDLARMSASQFVKKNVGIETKTHSNGENGFYYFVRAISEGGLYLLDEPENSLSAERQLLLVELIQMMAGRGKCQFVISTHSPFILAIRGAKIYNIDAAPVKTCKWTELPNVRAFHEFFKVHDGEFE